MSSFTLTPSNFTSETVKRFLLEESNLNISSINNNYNNLHHHGTYYPTHLQLDAGSFLSARVVFSDTSLQSSYSSLTIAQSSDIQRTSAKNTILFDFHHPKTTFSFTISVTDSTSSSPHPISILPPCPFVFQESTNGNIHVRFMTTNKSVYHIEIPLELLLKGYLLSINTLPGLRVWSLSYEEDISSCHFIDVDSALIAGPAGRLWYMNDIDDQEPVEAQLSDSLFTNPTKLFTSFVGETPKNFLSAVTDTPKKLMSVVSGFIGSSAPITPTQSMDVPDKESEHQIVAITSTMPTEASIVPLGFVLNRSRQLRVYDVNLKTCQKSLYIPFKIPSEGETHFHKSANLLPETIKTYIRVFDQQTHLQPGSTDEFIMSFKLSVFVPRSNECPPFFVFYSAQAERFGQLKSLDYLTFEVVTSGDVSSSQKRSVFAFLVDYYIKPLNNEKWGLFCLWNKNKQSRVSFIELSFGKKVQEPKNVPSPTSLLQYLDQLGQNWTEFKPTHDALVRVTHFDTETDVGSVYLDEIFGKEKLSSRLLLQALIEYALYLSQISSKANTIVEDLQSESSFNWTREQLVDVARDLVGAHLISIQMENIADTEAEQQQRQSLYKIEWEKFLSICNQLSQDAAIPLSLNVDARISGDVFVYTKGNIFLLRAKTELELVHDGLHTTTGLVDDLDSVSPILSTSTLQYPLLHSSQNLIQLTGDVLDAVYCAVFDQKHDMNDNDEHGHGWSSQKFSQNISIQEKKTARVLLSNHLHQELIAFDQLATTMTLDNWVYDMLNSLFGEEGVTESSNLWILISSALSEWDPKDLCSQINELIESIFSVSTTHGNASSKQGKEDGKTVASLLSFSLQLFFKSALNEQLLSISEVILDLLVLLLFACIYYGKASMELKSKHLVLDELYQLATIYRQLKWLEWITKQSIQRKKDLNNLVSLLETMSVGDHQRNMAPQPLVLYLMQNQYLIHVNSWEPYKNSISSLIGLGIPLFVQQIGFLNNMKSVPVSSHISSTMVPSENQALTHGTVQFFQKMIVLKQFDLLVDLLDIMPKCLATIYYVYGVLSVAMHSGNMRIKTTLEPLEQTFKYFEKASHACLVAKKDDPIFILVPMSETAPHHLMIHYFEHVTRFYQHSQLPQGVVYFGTRTEQLCKEDDGSALATKRDSILKMVFTAHLDLLDFDEAFMTLSKMTLSYQKECLGAFVTNICDHHEWFKLCQGQYRFSDLLEKDIEETLQFKSKNSLSLVLDASEMKNGAPNYTMILFTFYVRRNELKEAAHVMYSYARRIERRMVSYLEHKASASWTHEPSHVFDLHEMTSVQAKCYLSCLNLLKVLTSSNSVVDNDSTGYQGAFLVLDEATDPAFTGLIKEGLKRRKLEIHEDLIDPSTLPNIITINDIQKQSLLTLARLELSVFYPELLERLTGQIHIMASDFIALYVKEKMYIEAIQLATSFHLEMNIIFESMASSCVQMLDGSISLQSGLAPGLDQWLKQDEGRGTISDRGFRLLGKMVSQYDSAETGYVYHAAIADRLLSINSKIKLPVWLYQFYLNHHPADLLKIYLKHELLDEACTFVARVIDEQVHSVKTPHLLFRHLPYSQIDQLRLLIDKKASKDTLLVVYKKGLEESLNIYLQQVSEEAKGF